MGLSARQFLLDFFSRLRSTFAAVVLKLKNKRVFALVLILLLLFLLAFLKWWTSRGQVAAVYQTEIPQGISKDSLGNLSKGQRRLLDEMIARNLQSRTRLTLAAARPAVVILTQNNQPILPGASVQRPIGGPTGPIQTPGTATPSPTTPPTFPTLTPTPSPTPIPSGPLIIEAEDLIDWANPSVSGWEKPCGNGFCTASTHWTTSTNPLNFAYFSPISHNLQAVVERGPNRGSFIIQSTNPTRSATLNLRQQGDFTFPTIDLLTGLSAGSQQITITPNGDGFVTFDKFILPAGCTREQVQPPSNQCTDSDNGMNYFVKGTTTGYFIDDRFLSLNDSCQSINPDGSNPDWVLEYHCEAAGSTPQGRTPYISTSSFHCPHGCQDGACKGAPTTPTPAPTCTDSDGGLDYYVKGTVNQSGDPLSPHTDYCTEIDGISWDKSYLIEYTCENNHWKMNTYDCPNGCQGGVCKGTPSSACTDSDGGKNYAVKGHLVGEMEQPGGATYHLDSYDACTDATRLSEYYCYVKNGKNYGTWETYNCAAEGTVCEDGVCKGTPPPAANQCSDSDGGKNYTVKGHLVGEMEQPGGATYHLDSDDACTNAIRLSEYYCYVKNGKNYGTWETYNCAAEGAICQDGVCKGTPPPATRGAPSISLEGEANDYYQDKNKHNLYSDLLKIYQEVEGKLGLATRPRNLKIRLSSAQDLKVNYFDASTNEIVLSPQSPPSREELTSLVIFALYDEQVFLKPKVFAEEIKKIDVEKVSEEVFGTPTPAAPTPKPSPLTSACASDWQEYVNQNFGFKLKIPAGWTDDSIDEQQSESLVYRRLISTLNPPEQMDPKYKISSFEVLVSSKDLKTHENYGTWFDNNTGNQKKSSVTFKGIQAEKFVDETEVACASQTEEMKNCAHRFEMYYFKKDNLYYLLNIGLYMSADVKEKNEKILSCFLDNFELIEKGAATTENSEAKAVPDGLKPCNEEVFKIGESHCDNLGKKPVCGYSKLVFDNGGSRIDLWDYANACFYCSQFDKSGFSELRGTKFYSLGYQEGACQ